MSGIRAEGWKAMFSVIAEQYRRAYVQDGGHSVGVEWLRSEGDRDIWRWWVLTLRGGDWDGEDLTTASAFRKSAEDVLRILAGFLAAHAETANYPMSDNANLFPFDPELSDRLADMIHAELGWEE